MLVRSQFYRETCRILQAFMTRKHQYYLGRAVAFCRHAAKNRVSLQNAKGVFVPENFEGFLRFSLDDYMPQSRLAMRSKNLNIDNCLILPWLRPNETAPFDQEEQLLEGLLLGLFLRHQNYELQSLCLQVAFQIVFQRVDELRDLAKLQIVPPGAPEAAFLQLQELNVNLSFGNLL